MPAIPVPTPEISIESHRSRLRRLEVEGGSIAYLDVGPRDGEPVVLVHGMPTSSWLYRLVAERLAAAGVRAIAPDLLGFGASDKPRAHAAYEAPRQAARILELLDHLGIGRATFVAHDLGGPWTFEIADRHPERIGGLVILNTSAYAELMTPPREMRMAGGPMGPLMLGLMGSRAGKPLIRKFFGDFTGQATRLSSTATDGHWLPLNEGATRPFRAFAVGIDDVMAQFRRYATALRRLDVPASLVWGAADPVLRPDRLIPRFVADLRIPAADVHVLDGASHFLQEDRPDEVAELIAGFALRRAEAAA